MNLDLPKQVTEVLDNLEKHGYSAYIHGECVRVLIKGQTLSNSPSVSQTPAQFEFDILTNAEIKRVLTIFDGYNVIEDNLDQGELIVTVLGVALSITSYASEATTLETVLTAKIADKRTFTFDAIAYSNKKGFFDPWGGIDALNNSKLILLPEKSIRRQDIEDILLWKNVSEVLAEYNDVITTIIPELNMLAGFDKLAEITGINNNNPPLLSHTYKSVGCSSPILTLRYALLFHELGKPDCHSRNSDDEDFFYGHAERSRIYAVRIMTRLECKPQDIKETASIIGNYQKVLQADNDNIKDLADDYPDLLKLLLLFNCADHRAGSDKDVKKSMTFKKLAATL